MLAAMRRNASNPLVLIPVGVIVFVFVFTFGQWGGSDVSGDLPMAASVNGRVIAKASFSVQYARQYQNKQMINRGYGIEDAQREGLREQVLDNLIDRELLAQVAEERGIMISDEEVVETIKQRFFPDKDFDREEYKRLVNGYYQTSEPRFEAQVRRDMLAERMQKLVEQSLHVSPSELKEEYDNRYNRVDLEVVRIDPLFFKDLPKPLNEEVEKWAADNGDKIEEHYNEHINRYRKEKRVKARHILVKAAEDASDADKAAARKKAEEAKKRVTDGGEDFAKVAQEVSEDAGSAKNGGDLGTFGKGRMVKPFEEAAFAMKAGDVSDIVESRFGFHVIKVEEVLEPEVQELDEVKLEIAREMMKDTRQRDEAMKLADSALEQLKGGAAVDELEIEGLLDETEDPLDPTKRDPFAPRVENTGWFAKNARYVPRVGVSPDIVEAAFALTAEAPVADKVFEVSKRLYVVKLKDRETADPAKFADEKQSLQEGILRARRQAVVKQFLEAVREDSEIKKNPEIVLYES